MSAKNRRLDRLTAGLTARERVVLIQTALYEDREPDARIWNTTPDAQWAELHRLGRLASQAHLVLTTHLVWQHFVVEDLRSKWMLLMSLVGWALDRHSILLDASLVTHVPISESDYASRRRELAADQFGIRDAVELMLATETDDSNKTVRRAEKEVRAAIKAGELKATRKGRGFEMSYQAFCDWRGESVQAFPDWGRAYEVVPDGEVYFGDSAERLRLASESGPHHPGLVLPPLALSPNWSMPEEDQSLQDRLLARLARQVHEEVPRREMEVAALTEVVEAVEAEFRDEAIVAKVNRAMLADARTILASLREDAPRIIGEIDAAPPHEASFAEIRRQIFDSES